jgi:hypothetical protein
VPNAVNHDIEIQRAANVAAATYASKDLSNPSHRGVKLVVDITAGPGNVTVYIEGKDPVSGKYFTLLASAALANGSTTVLTVHPEAVAAANLAAKDILPATWRVRAVVAGGNATFTIGGSKLI